MVAKGPWWKHVPLWLFPGMFVIGGVLSRMYPEGWVLSDIFRDSISNALMVAAILGVTVDGIAKDKLLRDVSRDIWAHLMGRNLPPEVKDFIQSAILNTKLVCTNSDIRFRLDERQDRLLQMTVEITREITNFGDTKESLDPFLSVFEEYQPKFLKYVSEREKRPDVWTGTGDGVSVKSADAAVTAKARKIRFSPYGQSGRDATLTWKYSAVMRRTDTEIYAFEIPSVKTKVVLDNAPSSVEFKVDGHEGVGNIWRIDKVTWGGQYIRVRWFDRSDQTEDATEPR